MAGEIKIVSWNVNGIRAAERKGFLDWLGKSGHDIVCVQETKVSEEGLLSDALKNPDGYKSFWDYSTEKKGYSGVATFTKKEPKKVKTNFGKNLLTPEGRMLETDFGDFVLLNGYFPNGGGGPERLAYKMKFYDQFLAYAKKLVKANKKVIFCGDINTAHNEIDLARPRENQKNTGFLPMERAWLDKVEKAGFIDTYRHFNPEKSGAYSYWDQKTRARDRNVGWRIDYFFLSPNLEKNLVDAWIDSDVYGSDHCPIGVKMKI